MDFLLYVYDANKQSFILVQPGTEHLLSKPKFSMPWVRYAFGNVSRPILRTNFVETTIETLYETKYFQSVTCISLENGISTARTLKVLDCTLTFHLEICEMPRLFSRPIPRLFWDQYWDSLWAQILETDTEIFLRPKFSRPTPFFETKYFPDRYCDFFETKIVRDRYWDFLLRPNLSRPIPILSKNEKSLDTEKFRDEMSHSGAKPQKCTQCNYSVNKGASLKKHFLKHTGENTVNCQQCDQTSTV